MLLQQITLQFLSKHATQTNLTVVPDQNTTVTKWIVVPAQKVTVTNWIAVPAQMACSKPVVTITTVLI